MPTRPTLACGFGGKGSACFSAICESRTVLTGAVLRFVPADVDPVSIEPPLVRFNWRS
jgi:hypothetical protein